MLLRFQFEIVYYLVKLTDLAFFVFNFKRRKLNSGRAARFLALQFSNDGNGVDIALKFKLTHFLCLLDSQMPDVLVVAKLLIILQKHLLF